jgi:DNA-binding NarL/FixJ family response regulator
VTEEPITILIADDHPMFRIGLRTRLSAEPGFAVVGEAENGDESVALAIDLQPDVVLMDLQMPGMNGIEATRRLRDACPSIAVLVVTMFDDNSIFTAVQAGARGYILKGANPEETVRAIRAVANGEAIFSPSVAKRLLHYFATPEARTTTTPAFPELTEREREVLALLAQGYTNQVIADRLSLTPKTVRNYVSNIFSKLQVADRAEAMLAARAAGLGREGE